MTEITEVKRSIDLVAYFTGRAKTCEYNIAKFREDFIKDPAYALSWSNNTFQDAAKLRVYNQILSALKDGDANLDNIKSTMLDRVLHKSKYPAQSTSPTSNLIEQYELAVCAEICSDLSHY